MDVSPYRSEKTLPAHGTVVGRSEQPWVIVLWPQRGYSQASMGGQAFSAESASVEHSQLNTPLPYAKIWVKIVGENSCADATGEIAPGQKWEFTPIVDTDLRGEYGEQRDDTDNQIGVFLDSVYSLAKQGKEDHAIDVIFEYVNSLLVQREFKSCDELLAEVNIEKIPPVLMVSFLTITAAAKPKLKNRDRFFKLVWGMVARQRGQDAADRLLDGLD